MKILLDIDGVLVTTPAWKAVEIQADGFLKFNEIASKNLSKIIEITKASIILTTTHRINYSITEWRNILETRGIFPPSISKVNNKSTISDIENRAIEIKKWVDNNQDMEPFVIIDDDLSINGLPKEIRNKCVLTRPMIGLDEEAMNKVLKILLENNSTQQGA